MDAPNRIHRALELWYVSPRPQEEEKVEQPQSASQNVFSSVLSYLYPNISEKDRLIQQCRSVLDPIPLNDPKFLSQLEKLLDYPPLRAPFDELLKQAGQVKGSDKSREALLEAKENFLSIVDNLCPQDVVNIPTLHHLINFIAIDPIIDETVNQISKNLENPKEGPIKYAREHTLSLNNSPLTSVCEKVLIKRGYVKYPANLFWSKCSRNEDKLTIGLAVPGKKEVEISVSSDRPEEIREGVAQLFMSLAAADIPKTVKDNTAEMQAESFLMMHNILARICENFNVEPSDQFIENNLTSLEMAESFEAYLTASIKTKNLYKALIKLREPLDQGIPMLKEKSRAKQQFLSGGWSCSEELQQLIVEIDNQTRNETDYNSAEKAAIYLCSALEISPWSSKGKEIWKACGELENEVNEEGKTLFLDDLNSFLEHHQRTMKVNRDTPGSEDADRLTHELSLQLTNFGDFLTLEKPVKELIQKSYDQWCKNKSQPAPPPAQDREKIVSRLAEIKEQTGMEVSRHIAYLEKFDKSRWNNFEEKLKELSGQKEELRKLFYQTARDYYDNEAPKKTPLKHLAVTAFPREIGNIVNNPESGFKNTRDPVNVDGGQVVPTEQFLTDLPRQRIIVNGSKVCGSNFYGASTIEDLLRELRGLHASADDITKILRFCDQGIAAGEIATLETYRYMTCNSIISAGDGFFPMIVVDDAGTLMLTLEIHKNTIDLESNEKSEFRTKIICDFDGYDNGDIYVIHSSEKN